jgi:HlyD family secretion protein
VDQAKANLDKLTAPATDTDLAIQQASVAQAEESLRQARLNLDDATLRAPFGGIIASVNVVPGSTVGGGTVVAKLIDRGTLHVDLKLSENDVVKVAVGQPATLTSDSLPGWTARGTVSYLAPAAETTNGVETYLARVSFPGDDPALRVGMTANLAITTAHHDNALLVPSTALLPKGAGHVVERPSADGKTTTDVDVQTGLTDGTMTEITSGLREGDRIIALPSTGAPHSSNGFFH